MNWRGILGIYAGLAIVLSGAWFWVQSSALWALGVVAAGLVVAAVSVTQIVMKLRGPRSTGSKSAKGIKPARAARGKVASNAEDAQTDSVAKARMAMIAERATGRSSVNDALAKAYKNGNGVEYAETGQVPDFIEGDAAGPSSDANSDEPTPSDANAIGLADAAPRLDAVEISPAPAPLDVPDLTATPLWSETLGAPLVSKRIVSEALALEPESEVEIASAIEREVDAEPKLVSVAGDLAETTFTSEKEISAALLPQTPNPAVAHEAVFGAQAEATFEAEPASYEADPVALVARKSEKSGPVALDSLPGFPWTARFIGIWAREVRFACPDDLRGAVIHWQRWADGQAAGSPVIEEVAAEFNAMLDVWRAGGAEVLGLSSDDWTAGQLAAEASEDAALAALLPEVLRAPSVAAY
jgi:hypothetical protein